MPPDTHILICLASHYLIMATLEQAPTMSHRVSAPICSLILFHISTIILSKPRPHQVAPPSFPLL